MNGKPYMEAGQGAQGADENVSLVLFASKKLPSTTKRLIMAGKIRYHR